ncbi:hypothetical protein [Pedobacter miscanthi]|uniref:hypothetical protein n=1 Tax=Pedobacter miscanthi TaxID=2259170 RepID=UPI00292F140D|nr:hypothetical protein [Pedobacter miscanthi]
MSFNKNGWRELDFNVDDVVISQIRERLMAYSDEIRPYQGIFSGKGIVFCAGGLGYFSCVWISICKLRGLGCSLPIEVWYLGTEFSEEVIDQLEKFNVKCHNFLDHKEYKQYNIHSFGLKPLAILLSQFEEVMFLDADNLAIADPSYLFEDENYKMYGTIFWPDMWRTSPDNPIWKITDCQDYAKNEQESGQLLINKKMCWEELNLCLYLNIQKNIYYRFLYGDKDTFKFAWLARKKKYYMIDGFPGVCGYDKDGVFLGNTLVQHTPSGRALFFHRNLLKWDVTLTNECVWSRVKRFRSVTENSSFTFSFSSESHFYLDINGDIEELDVDQIIPGIEAECMDILLQLRSEKFYLDFVHHTHLRINRFKNSW